MLLHKRVYASKLFMDYEMLSPQINLRPMRCPSADCTGIQEMFCSRGRSFVIFSDPGKGSGTMSFVIFSDPGRGSGTMCQLHNNTNDRQTNDIFQVHMTVNALYVDRLWLCEAAIIFRMFQKQQPRLNFSHNRKLTANKAKK